MKKYIIIGIVVVMLAVAAYFIFFRKSSGQEETGAVAGSGDKGGTRKIETDTNPMPLKVGSGYVKGSDQNKLVKDIQQALNVKHKSGLIVDGKFGPKTLAALKQNGYPVVIYWKHYKQITGNAIYVNGQEVTDTSSFWDWL